MLKLKRVCKTFNAGTINEKRAVIDLDLSIDDGDFVTVIGGNGAGKSTILNLISGVYEVDSGSITLDGRDVTDEKEHARAALLGRVFQDPMMGTAGNMEIEENLAMALRRGRRRGLSWGVTRAERELFAERVASLELGLESRMHSKVGLLSGGQRQALTLLMATLKKPRLLLLDEHTAALDPKTARKVLELTADMVERERLSTFMVTHNMKDAIRLGSRLIMLHEGRVIYDVRGDEKRRLEVPDLLAKFEQARDEGAVNDRMLLA